jgi:DnaK suppressor protein
VTPVVPLTDGRRREVRRALEAELRRLERSMGDTDERFGPVELDACATGRAPEAKALERRAMARRLRERENEKLGELQRALRRLDDGAYGACTKCGEAISSERLDVFPAAPTCAGCVTAPPAGG